MINLKPLIETFKKAIYGRDVRQSIVDLAQAIGDNHNEQEVLRNEVKTLNADTKEENRQGKEYITNKKAEMDDAVTTGKASIESTVSTGKAAVDSKVSEAVSTIGAKTTESEEALSAKTQSGISSLEQKTTESTQTIEAAISRANESKAAVDTAITKAGESKTALEDTILRSEGGKSNLDGSIQRGKIKGQELENYIAEINQIIADGKAVTKDELKEEILKLKGLSIEVLDTLPESGKAGVIYFIKTATQGEQNLFDEYAWVQDKWEMIGSKSIDLSQYATTTSVDELKSSSESKFNGLKSKVDENIHHIEDTSSILNSHTDKNVCNESGVHGIRYFDEEIQVKKENGSWITATKAGGGGGGIAPSNVMNIRAQADSGSVTLFWQDPEDTIIDGQLVSTWKGTKVIQKVGSYPESPNDGTLVVDNRERNKYQDNGFAISNLSNGREYFFAFFPYSDTGSVNLNPKNRVTATPRSYRVMTAKINLSNSNPATCVTYEDDAVGMMAGSDAWDKFFGHYPCLFKDGKEVGKLKRDDFTRFEDGRVADITSGSAGDVMIAFPMRGVKISTSGQVVTVSMTDKPDDSNFEYYAHTKGLKSKDIFYIGAYKGYKDGSGKLRSLSGKAPTENQTISIFRKQAQANGTGYEQSAFYQLIFRQVMYILKYKNLDSQSAVGEGCVLASNSAILPTGGSESYGMDSELIRATNPSYMTDQEHHVKLFGIEDFWGNINEFIDGFVTDSSRNCLTSTGSYNDAGTGYINNGNLGSSEGAYGYMSLPAGTNELGFILKEKQGSETMFFADFGYISAGYVAIFGGYWYDKKQAGIFHFKAFYRSSAASGILGSRLMYL